MFRIKSFVEAVLVLFCQGVVGTCIMTAYIGDLVTGTSFLKKIRRGDKKR